MIVGIGIDLVTISEFGEQLASPGTAFGSAFTPGSGVTRPRTGGEARYLAARWAAKEAVIKAWSGSRYSQRPVLPENIHRDIEVVTDTWGRPRIRLSGAIGEYLADMTMHVTLTHDGDTAAAFVVLEQEGQPSST